MGAKRVGTFFVGWLVSMIGLLSWPAAASYGADWSQLKGALDSISGVEKQSIDDIERTYRGARVGMQPGQEAQTDQKAWAQIVKLLDDRIGQMEALNVPTDLSQQKRDRIEAAKIRKESFEARLKGDMQGALRLERKMKEAQVKAFTDLKQMAQQHGAPPGEIVQIDQSLTYYKGVLHPAGQRAQKK